MSDKKLKAWSFRLHTPNLEKLIPESKCNELMDLINQWAVKNDFEIDSFKRPKFTLQELIDKCDPEAPSVEHDWQTNFESELTDNFMADRELPEYQERKLLLAKLENIDLCNNMDLWEKVSQNIKNAIADTTKTREHLSKSLDEMNNATKKAEDSIDNTLSFVAESNKRIEKMEAKLFDPAEHIEVDNPEFIQEYLEMMLSENGIEGLQRAITHVSKALTLRESQLREDNLYLVARWGNVATICSRNLYLYFPLGKGIRYAFPRCIPFRF